MRRLWPIDTIFFFLISVVHVNLQCSFSAMDLAEYKGCWKDGQARMYPFVYGGGALKNLTVDYCILGCADEGFHYAGLQAHDWCHCGDYDPYLTIEAYPKVPEVECTMQCSSNQNQMCGGRWRLAIYRIHNLKSINNRREYVAAYIGQSFTTYPLSIETETGKGMRAIYNCAQSCTNTPKCRVFSFSSTYSMCYKFKSAKLCDQPSPDGGSSVFYLL